MNVYRQKFCSTVHADRTLALIPEEHTLDVKQQTPSLNRIPDCLWAKGKHDVGLTKDMQPVTVTPKSNYGPCQNQYPLKMEAMASLLYLNHC